MIGLQDRYLIPCKGIPGEVHAIGEKGIAIASIFVVKGESVGAMLLNKAYIDKMKIHLPASLKMISDRLTFYLRFCQICNKVNQATHQ